MFTLKVMDDARNVIDDIKNAIKQTINQTLSESQPKEDDKYSLSEIINHQKNCKSSDCPFCSVMNEKITAEKINNIEKRIDNLISESSIKSNNVKGK